MQVTLTLPGLLLPAEIRTDTLFDLHAPALSRLLGRAERHESGDDWLAKAFGLPSPLPVAALRCYSAATRKVDAGGTPPGGYLCLDPVHLHVTREGVTLADPAELKLDAEEAAALIDAIAPLFAPWGKLTASTPGAWELALTRTPRLETRPLPDCISKPADPRLPGGEDGREWRRLLSEAQTLLHAHPVNSKRNERGLSPINSLWLWGYGFLPDNCDTSFEKIYSSTPLYLGLARLADIPVDSSPPGLSTMTGHTLVCDARLFAPARAFDAKLWRNRLLELEREWFAPLLDALRQGRCREAHLIGGGFSGPDVEFHITRRRLWRFWRRDLPLAELQ